MSIFQTTAVGQTMSKRQISKTISVTVSKRDRGSIGFDDWGSSVRLDDWGRVRLNDGGRVGFDDWSRVGFDNRGASVSVVDWGWCNYSFVDWSWSYNSLDNRSWEHSLGDDWS